MEFKEYCYLSIYVPKFLEWAEDKKHSIKTYRVIKQFDWSYDEYKIIANTGFFTDKDIIDEVNDKYLDYKFKVKDKLKLLIQIS